MKGMKGKGKTKDKCKNHGKGMGKGHHGMHGMEEMEGQKEYSYLREVKTSFDKTVAKVREELKKEGFGVLSEVRVDALFREKLGLEMSRT